MSRILIILLGLGILAAFGYYCVYEHSTASTIQTDIDTRVRASLSQTEKLADITITTSGRDITLSGDVINEEFKQKAAELAKNTHGVRKVTNQLSIVEIEPETDKQVEPEIEPVVEVEPEVTQEPEPTEQEIEVKKEVIHTPIVADLPDYSCQQEFDFLLSNEKIQFATASAVIDPSSYSLLNDLIEIATTECVDAKFEIAGHTDSQGNENYNLDLSQQRATSVMEYFIQNGLQAEHITAVGYGESTPIADNETDDGRAKNRRIELTVKLEEIQ